MPRFDKTGPEGAGSQTGWRDGDCTEAQAVNTSQHADAGTGWRQLWRMPYYFRLRWARLGQRGRGGRGTKR